MFVYKGAMKLKGLLPLGAMSCSYFIFFKKPSKVLLLPDLLFPNLLLPDGVGHGTTKTLEFFPLYLEL